MRRPSTTPPPPIPSGLFSPMGRVARTCGTTCGMLRHGGAAARMVGPGVEHAKSAIGPSKDDFDDHEGTHIDRPAVVGISWVSINLKRSIKRNQSIKIKCT
eukprot:1876547-Pyramimonas_sp.AAC.2